MGKSGEIVTGSTEISRSPKSFRKLERDVDMDSDDVDDPGLPAMGSRNAKWWYSTYHNVTAIVGAGVLGLPSAMVYLTWGGGIFVLAISWVITLFTLWQMVQMHENLPKMLPGQRINTYHELGQQAFGKRLGLWIVLPQQLIVQVSVDIVYMVTGGQCLWLFYQLILCDKQDIDPVSLGDGDQCCGRLGPTTFTIFFALPQFFLSQLGGFDAIASISLIASVMSICYCAIAWIDSVTRGVLNHKPLVRSATPMAVCPTSYHFPHYTDATQAFGVLSALGVVAFAYTGHNVVLEIQATLPSTEKQPAKFRMWRGVKVAYAVVAICYFPVALVGYWAYGNYLASLGNSHGYTGGNILLQLGGPKGWIAAANLMVVIHLTGSYQVYAMPVFDLMEKLLIETFHFNETPWGCTSMLRIVTRSAYVFFTAFLACTFPFFSDLLAFFGGLANTPTTYFLPCVIWLILKKPKPFSISWLINWFVIIAGVLLMIAATIGGFRMLLVDPDVKYHSTYLNCSSTLDFDKKNCPLVHVTHTSKYEFYSFTCKAAKNINVTKCHVTFSRVSG